MTRRPATPVSVSGLTVSGPRASSRSSRQALSRASAVLLALGVLATLALPMLVCVASAGGGPETPAGRSVADESSAALGSISRLLHGDGCVRLDPWMPVELARACATLPTSSAPVASRLDPPHAAATVIGAEPQRRL